MSETKKTINVVESPLKAAGVQGLTSRKEVTQIILNPQGGFLYFNESLLDAKGQEVRKLPGQAIDLSTFPIEKTEKVMASIFDLIQE